MANDARPHVVVVGGGFGGLEAVRALSRAPVRVTLVDRRNHHLFQPLLYQMATAALNPSDIAYPIRAILRKQSNATVLLGEVVAVDPETFIRDAELVSFMPHMHLRGKDMTLRLAYPDGRAETVLAARYNFNWQLGYEVEKPIKVPRGTRMQVIAHFDNSANNKFNPEPARNVAWGDLTSQEMMLPWFGVVVDGIAKPEAIAFYDPHIPQAAANDASR